MTQGRDMIFPALASRMLAKLPKALVEDAQQTLDDWLTLEELHLDADTYVSYLVHLARFGERCRQKERSSNG